jgi:3-methyladenine DNA glycosylase/8-oxoguanine DNA glycosylase
MQETFHEGGTMTDKQRVGPADLGIDLSDGKPQQLYRWFLACLLFARPIQQAIAAGAYRALIDRGLTSPEKFAHIGREPLRKLLNNARYARYDYVTADTLHETMAQVVKEYGSVSKLVKTAESAAELEKRLTAFKGIGEKTAGIFLQEVPGEFNGRR